MNTIENRIVDSVKRKFSAPLLPFVESISLAKSPLEKMVVRYFWEDYAPFFFITILAFSLSRLILFLFPSNVITNSLIISMTVIFFILDAYWPTRFSSRFTNKTGYGFSAFYSLPLKSEQLIKQLFITHFILSGFLLLTIVSFFIGYLDIKSVYCLFSIKFIALLIFAGMVTYQKFRWLLFVFGSIILGLTFYGYFYPGKIIYQLPLTVIFAVAIYYALVFSFYENRTSHKKASRIDVNNEKGLRSFDELNSRKSKTGFSLFKKGYSSDVMLSSLILQLSGISLSRIIPSIVFLSYLIWNNSPHYLLYIPILIGVITIPLAWIGRQTNSSTEYSDNYISILPISIEKWGNQISLVNLLLFSIAFLLAFLLSAEYGSIYLLILVWIIPLLEIKDNFNRWVYKYLKLLNGTLRILSWFGYILIPCGVLTIYFGDMIPSFMKAVLIIILLSLSLSLLVSKSFILTMIGEWYGVFGKKTRQLFFISVFVLSILAFYLLSTYLSANVLSGILQIPLSSLSATLINLCLAITWGISQSLTVFIDPMDIYFRRHQ